MASKTTRWALAALVLALLLGGARAEGDRKQPKDRIEKVLHRLELLEERVARLETHAGFDRLLEAARRGDPHARELLERMARQIHEVLGEPGRGDQERIRREIEERERRIRELREELEHLRAEMEGRHEQPRGVRAFLEELERRMGRIERELVEARERGREREVRELEGMLARHREAKQLARKAIHLEEEMRQAAQKGQQDRLEELERTRDALREEIERLAEGAR